MPDEKAATGTTPATPPKATTLTAPAPVPLAAFGNVALRDSVAKALEGVPSGDKRAVLEVENKGAGVMFVQRSASGKWEVAAGVRFDFKDRGVAARLQASWR